jgi:hypothetical protein
MAHPDSSTKFPARIVRKWEAEEQAKAGAYAAHNATMITLNPTQRALIAGRLANVSSVGGMFGSELRDLKRQRATEIRMDSLAILADRFPDLVEALHAAEVQQVRRLILKVEDL